MLPMGHAFISTHASSVDEPSAEVYPNPQEMLCGETDTTIGDKLVSNQERAFDMQPAIVTPPIQGLSSKAHMSANRLFRSSLQSWKDGRRKPPRPGSTIAECLTSAVWFLQVTSCLAGI